MGESSGTARIWAFTLNNPTDSDESNLAGLVTAEIAKTILYGREVGESGTPHLQGCVIFENPVRMAGIRKTFEDASVSSCHLSKGKSRKALVTYCKKDGDWVCHGPDPGIPGQGARTDLKDAAMELLHHRSMFEFKCKYPHMYVKYHRGFEKLLVKESVARVNPPIVTWIYGPTGTGKTRFVFEEEKREDLWIASVTLQWFDGYDGHPAVLIDDFRASYCPYHHLLRFLDRYPMPVPVKGGFTDWSPIRIYITTVKHPSETYNVDEDIAQLIRRITNIKFTGDAHAQTQSPDTFHL